jgi:hypothetical protein
MNEVRSLLQAGPVLPSRARIEGLLEATDTQLAAAAEPGSRKAIGRLQGEMRQLADYFRDALALEEQVAAERRERRCAELKARWWSRDKADSLGADVEPLTTSEREFLNERCGFRR